MRVINTRLLSLIFEDIKNNNKITECFLAEKYNLSERTIRRYIRLLKNQGLLTSKDFGRKKVWQVISK